MTERKSYEQPRIAREEKLPVAELGKRIEEQKELRFTRELLQAFPDGNVYVVGGTVRDAMMGRKISKDYDLVVTGIPTADLEKFLLQYGRVDLVGRNFGVFKIVPEGSELDEPIDVALPRRETAAGTGGYRDFDVQADHRIPIADDLSRRDFTINALAWDLRNHQLVDPFEGILDLREQKLRAVREPRERFQEDYSRILRGLRFAVKFGFAIEEKTWKALQELMPRINDTREVDAKVERVTPNETIAKEFVRSLEADPVATLDLWEQAQALREILPECAPMRGCEQSRDHHSEGDVWTHTRLALSKLMGPEFRTFFPGTTPDAETILAVFFHDIEKPTTQGRKAMPDGNERITFYGHEEKGAETAQKICDRLKFSAIPGAAISHENIVWIVRNHLFPNHPPEHVKKTTLEKMFFKNPSLGQKLLHVAFADASASVRENGTVDLERLRAFRAELDALAIAQKEKGPELPKPLVSGNTVMEILKIQPSRRVGEILDDVRERQLNGEIKTKEEAEAYLHSLSS